MPLGGSGTDIEGSEHLGWMLRGSTPRYRTVSVSVVMLTETIAPDCPRIGQALKRSGYPRGLLRKM